MTYWQWQEILLTSCSFLGSSWGRCRPQSGADRWRAERCSLDVPASASSGVTVMSAKTPNFQSLVKAQKRAAFTLEDHDRPREVGAHKAQSTQCID